MTQARGVGRTVAKAAALIAVLTVLARIVGFARNIVFSNTVGQTCLGQTYQSANTIPNVIFEIVAGGALASVVVPLISGYVSRDDVRGASQTASALLTWTIAVLVPVSILIALLARPLTALILQDAPCDEAVDAGAAMLRIFAPQVVLYGVGVVLTGVLQAYKRFGGPALAPLLSSLVVIAAYVGFAVVAGRGAELGSVSTEHQLILSIGTTLGVVMLTLSLLVPLRSTPISLRPTWRFPDGQAARARALVAAGIAGLMAQQVFVAVTLVLANQDDVPAGAINVFVYAQTIFLLPWAVLAVPIATSVFPRLAEAAATKDDASFASTVSGAHIAITVLSGAATAALIAAATEISVVFVSRSPGEPSVDSLTHGVIGFAVGLVGYGAFALHSRALFAQGRARANAVAAALSWAVAIVVAVVLAGALDVTDRVAAMSWGNSAGVLLLGAILAVLTARATQASAVQALLAVCLTTVVGVGVGFGVASVPLPGALHVDPETGIMVALAIGVVKGLIAAVAAVLVIAATPGTDVRGALRVIRRRTAPQTEETT